MSKCENLFGHAWTMRSYQDPKRMAKGYITEKCGNNCKDGTPCDATRERKGSGAKFYTTVDKKGNFVRVPKRETNRWAGGELEKAQPGKVQKAQKKSGGEVTSEAKKKGCFEKAAVIIGGGAILTEEAIRHLIIAVQHLV